MATLHDVASRAGVSVATVSNVINNTRPVTPDTRNKVETAIKALNYVPNLAAKTLKTNNYNMIGIIAEDVSSFSTPPIIDAICEYLGQKNFTVNLFNLRTYSIFDHEQHKQQVANSLSILHASCASGIIYIGADMDNVSYLRSLIDIPVVFAYCSADGDDYTITYNDYEAAANIARHFILHGHKDFAIISGNNEQQFVQERISGFTAVLNKAGITLPQQNIRSGGWHFETARRQADWLLAAAPNRPTAIFAMNDIMACAVIASARNLSLNIPEDISVIGFDDRSCSAYSSPSITTMHIPLYDIGATAAEAIHTLIMGEDVPKKQCLLCELIERESVATCCTQ